MNAKHVELWQRLEQFQLDSAEAALPFSARLARENNWSPAYTQRVIAEYKRFAFLAAAAGHPVSPSEDVDQAWHLHLTYSENYWKVFCPGILGRPLHHQPTRGGVTERDKFQDWYARTLASYESFFGAPPPRDIWPPPDAHRKEKHNFIRVDRERNWVIPKPRLRLSPKFAACLGFGAIVAFCTAAMPAQTLNVFDWRGPDFLVFYCVFFAAAFSVALWLRRNLRLPEAAQPLSVPDLNGYATAFLNGGKVLAVNTAIASLLNQKILHFDAKERRLTSLVPEPLLTHELEKAVCSATEAKGGAPIADVRLAAKTVVDELAGDLKAQGLIVADGAAQKARAIPLLVTFAVIAAGVVKIIIGASRDKPVGFLVALCLVSAVISLAAFARRPLRSRKGDAVLERLKERHVGPRQLGKDVSSIPAVEFATIVGLFG